MPARSSAMLSSASCRPVAAMCSLMRSVNRSCAFTRVTSTSSRRFARAAS
ncbi:hypothetical protein ACFVIB_00210 [Streptomyces nigra]